MCMLHLPTAKRNVALKQIIIWMWPACRRWWCRQLCRPLPCRAPSCRYLTRVTGSLQAPKVPWTSLLVPCRHLCVHLADNFVHFAGTVQGKSWRHIVGHLVRHLRHLARHVVGGTVQACAYTVLVPWRHLASHLARHRKGMCLYGTCRLELK